MNVLSRLLQLDLPLFQAPTSGRPQAVPDEPRVIAIAGQVVHYVVRRSARRRTLGLVIDAKGLRALVPLRARQAEIERLIQNNARWVATKLREWQGAASAATRAWTPADPLPLFGHPLPLKVAPGRAGLARFDDLLILTVPRPEAGEAVIRVLREELKSIARMHFSQRLSHYSAAFGVATPDLRLSRAETRWGSCARDREGNHRVSLNWRMVHLDTTLSDYVIAHEIAHVKHMHHGPRFWSAVARLVPDYEVRRDAMRRLAAALPQL
ncbi:MAG: M48 family metallopeptidase [Burkholderiales bacterium]|nr:M48 family metallopeptidase [Burkholderiales bacterium]